MNVRGQRENVLLLVLACAEATLLLDRLAVGFLAPFILPDLNLSNFQLGLLSSLFSVSFALSGYVVSSWSDRRSDRWTWLTILILLFSACSAACAVAGGFASLAALRIALGILEGPFLPMALAYMADHSSESRRSFNMGFVQNVGAFLLAQLAGPIVLVWFAVRHGWRAAFLFTAVPGVILAITMLVIRPLLTQTIATAQATIDQPHVDGRFHRNVWLCVGIAACMGSWILLQMTFLPKYLVDVARMTPTHMSFVLSLLGIGGCISSIVLPTLSDRLGRRRVLMGGIALACATPIGVLSFYDNPALLTACVLVGSLAFGCSPLYVAVIPSDSTPKQRAARAIALVSASSALMGGVVAPAVAGRLADRFGLGMVFWIAGGVSLVALVLASALRRAQVERAPGATDNSRVAASQS